MKHWVDALLASRIASLKGLLTKNAGAVSELFPWLNDYLGRKAS